MATLAIFGGNSLLGQHVIDAAVNSQKFNSIRVWNYQSKPETRLATNNNPDALPLEHYSGFGSMDQMVEGANAVINVHECRDLSVQPASAEMEEHNVYFIDKLLEACHKGRVQSLVHLSSIFLQCTSLWPNVYGRESKPLNSQFVPFKAYVDTKRRAEQSLMNDHSDLQIVIGRVGTLYGEGDVCSPVCDSVYLADKLGYLPILGDRGGVYQMTYAGNVAHSMVDMVSQLQKRVEIRREIVNLRDDTPNEDIYATTLIPLITSGTIPLASFQIPFFIFFPIFYLLAGLNWFLNVLGFPTRLNHLPDPIYIYFLLRHWTFFSDFKQRIFFGDKSKFSYNESKRRSAAYYSKLSTDQIRSFSWQMNCL